MTAALWYYLRPPPGGGDRGTTQEKLGLVLLLFVLLGIKMVAAPHFGYETDLGTYKAWALRLADRGPADFYAPNYFCDYPPGLPLHSLAPRQHLPGVEDQHVGRRSRR